jgi:hypothetical protein
VDATTDSSLFVLSPTMAIGVFLVGVFPFVVAAIEFWRRIAVGAPFGTGTDSIFFPQQQRTDGESVGGANVNSSDNESADQRAGGRVLGPGALILAYALFALATSVLGLVLFSLVTSTVDLSSQPVV